MKFMKSYKLETKNKVYHFIDHFIEESDRYNCNAY